MEGIWYIFVYFMGIFVGFLGLRSKCFGDFYFFRHESSPSGRPPPSQITNCYRFVTMGGIRPLSNHKLLQDKIPMQGLHT